MKVGGPTALQKKKNCTIKKRPRRVFGKRPSAPRKPKGKPGRPFVGAHGGGSGRGDRPWVHSPRAEGPGLVKVGGRPAPQPRRPSAASRTIREDFQMAVGFLFLIYIRKVKLF